MSDVAISVEALGKRYRIGARREPCDTLRDAIADALKVPFRMISRLGRPSADETIWALKDVSFEVKRGEVVGVIGRNGAGKSTLLKILSRITTPTEGRAEIHGRVGSLLEVGTGFHPELTGRENIFLNGSILGMKRREIRARFDEIVAFAEIEKFLDTPVKRYSSGMYVRLAFAVAAHLEPEILLVDEVLAVGDAAFQKKCLGKMGEVAKEGRTVLFVSHNMAAVQRLCSICTLLDDGHIGLSGATNTVIAEYLEKILPALADIPLAKRTDRSGNGRARFTSFHVEDRDGRRVPALQSGMDAVFVFGYACMPNEVPKDVSVGFGLYAGDGRLLFVLYSSYTDQDFSSIPRAGEFRGLIPHLPLNPGRYRVGARLVVASVEADWPKDTIGYVDVEGGDFFGTGRRGFEGRSDFLVDGSWLVRG